MLERDLSKFLTFLEFLTIHQFISSSISAFNTFFAQNWKVGHFEMFEQFLNFGHQIYNDPCAKQCSSIFTLPPFLFWDTSTAAVGFTVWLKWSTVVLWLAIVHSALFTYSVLPTQQILCNFKWKIIFVKNISVIHFA